MRHEGEILRPPKVAIVDAGHQNIRQEDTDILVDLEPERAVQAGRADEVPVEAPGQEAHALVVTRATEDVAEHGAGVVREAEDRNAGEERENP